jgi:hypothetical protein
MTAAERALTEIPAPGESKHQRCVRRWQDSRPGRFIPERKMASGQQRGRRTRPVLGVVAVNRIRRARFIVWGVTIKRTR